MNPINMIAEINDESKTYVLNLKCTSDFIKWHKNTDGYCDNLTEDNIIVEPDRKSIIDLMQKYQSLSDKYNHIFVKKTLKISSEQANKLLQIYEFIANDCKYILCIAEKNQYQSFNQTYNTIPELLPELLHSLVGLKIYKIHVGFFEDGIEYDYNSDLFDVYHFISQQI
jgi:hypothetical protein